MLISVIIPIYNTDATYLDRCIRSIVITQKIEYEIIIIDDGSEPHNSLEYSNISKNDEHILYFKKDNGGVSAARNFGIMIAKGDYLFFVDSDDIVAEDCFYKAIEIITSSQADFIIGAIQYIPGEKLVETNNQYVISSKKDLTELKIALSGVENNGARFQITGSPCGRFYKRCLAEKVKFPEHISFYEDQIFNRKYIGLINNAVVVDSIWYHYCQNDFSAMHTKLFDNYLNSLFAFWDEWVILNKKEEDRVAKSFFEQKGIDYYYTVVHTYIIPLKERWLKKRDIMKQIREKQIFKELASGLQINLLRGLKQKCRFLFLKYRLYALMYFFVWVKKIVA